MKSILIALSLTVSAACFAITLDERSAEPGEWGFRPAEGAEAKLNPPGLVWRPTEGVGGYTLQIARDAEFQDVVYAIDYTPWSSHCPSEALAAGTYHWRYAAADKTGRLSEWSRVRSFTVGADAVSFPQPGIDDLVSRLPGSHPKLFFRESDLPLYRELATGPLSEVFAGILKSADKLLKSPPDTTEPPKYPPGMERKSGEWKDMWWGNRRRTIAVLDNAATLAFAYRLTGNASYGKASRDLLMAFAAWDPKGSTQYQYNDEAAMPALYYAARTYDWAYPMLSPTDRAKVIDVMTVRGRDCFDHLRKRNHLWKPYASHSNRAWHFLGEVAIAFIDDIDEARTWLDYASTIFYTAYPVWTGGDGAWHEGTAYWVSYLNRFMFWAFVVDSAFDINVFEQPFFQQTGYYGMYVLPPGTKTGGFADQTKNLGSSKIATFMAIMAAGAGNDHWKWYADAHGAGPGGGYLGFIYGARLGNVPGREPTELPSSAVFADTGLAIFNTNLLDGADNVQVQFKSSRMGRQSHGYNANNAFLLNINGGAALLRAGRRDVYGGPHHAKYMWHSKSDNAILVNGEGQIPHSVDAQGRIVNSDLSPHMDIVEGEAGGSYENLNRWTRRIVFLKPSVIFIHDVLVAPEPATYQYTLHAESAFTIDGTQASWSGEFGALNVHLVKPEGLELSQHNVYDPPPHEWANFNLDEWHLTAETPKKAAEQQFISYIVVGDAKVTAKLASPVDTTSIVRMNIDGQEAVLHLSADRFRVQWHGIEREFSSRP